MFFSVAHTSKNNFTENYRFGSFVINVDAGWKYQRVGNNEILYKGYANSVDISQHLDTIISVHKPTYIGNFCVFNYDPQTDVITMHTDIYRSFPIYVSKDQITNLTRDSNTIWSDKLVSINNDLSVIQQQFDVIGNITIDRLSADEVVASVTEILDQRTKEFLLYNQLPIKSYLSGGVDSLLVYSFLKKHNANVELVHCEHVDYDWFWTQNSWEIKQNWGYTQIHHWHQSCVLASGAPGDEFMLRSPDTANQYLLFHGTNIPAQLNLNPDSLHAQYFQRPKHVSLINSHVVTETNPYNMYRSLCNNVVNDWQHWHIGNTLTWTPLRDLEIFKLFLRLNLTDAIGQIMDSSISISIIENNCPGLSGVISNHKNSGNHLSNLGRYFIQHRS